MRELRAALALGLVVALMGCSRSSEMPPPRQHSLATTPAPQRLPEAVRRILDGSDHLELLSLEPGLPKAPPRESFHGWKALGRIVIPDVERRRDLVRAIKEGIAESDGSIALCFEPRHGIRATLAGESVEFVICFECLQIEVHHGDGEPSKVLTTRSPEATLDRILESAGIQRAPKAAT